MEDTLSLRQAASQWTLAGDKHLLGLLEKIHKNIISKCQDATAQLDAMVDALDDASVDLQNVNNKFMALSNSQFVESRVYDDDVDVVTDNVVQAEPTRVSQQENELDKIKLALHKLQKMHEPVHILDSDSSDDEETSMILKPKDMYAHRPLPYIIGSAAWKSKWHAGLLPEESDSDSSTSKPEQAEEYSESEPEAFDVPTDKQRTISSSSSLPSEDQQAAPQKPADIAAELARRLAGPPLKAPVHPQEPESPPEPTTRKVYRVEKPAPATIFSDEPPPLDAVESEYSDDDIFAELHRKPPQNKPSQYNDIVDDLFGASLVADDEYNQKKSKTITREKSPLFDDVETNSARNDTAITPVDSEINVKKPVGGISLFGSNKGAESIGAAILKRNQRKSSTSDEGSDVTENEQTNVPNLPIEVNPKEPATDNKKIIEDLFAKPVKKNNKDNKNKLAVKPVVSKPVEAPKAKEKIDLFSDNLFDDIDDIFTTNVITKPKTDNNTKSIFDDDDLFSEVATKSEKLNKKDAKSLFESNDDLFTEKEKIDTKPINVGVSDATSDKIIKQKLDTKVKSIFDDDTDDDDLFSNIKINKPVPITRDTVEKINASDEKLENSLIINNASMPDVPNVKNKLSVHISVSNNKEINKTLGAKSFQSPNLFDDEDDDLFNTTIQKPSVPVSIDNEITDEKMDTINEVIDVHTPKNDLENERSFNITTSHTSNAAKENVQTNMEHLPFDNNSDTKLDKSKTHENVTINERIKENEQNISHTKHTLSDDSSKNNVVTENFEDPVFTKPKTENQDLFSDAFPDIPPAFEKPSEPKKSKNVNALFDDDSDDETLFFKKNDAISDEKPDVNYNSDRFRIFHDEPPDIDVDFTQKPLKATNDKPISLFDDETDAIFQIPTENPVEYVLPQDLDDISSKMETNKSSDVRELASESIKSKIVDISKLLEDESQNQDTNTIIKDNAQDSTKFNKEERRYSETDTSEESENRKSVGKLKPMNFNINVTTLLPGASPKKSKVIEETDGQSISTQSNEELNKHSPNKIGSTIVKSVSFDGDPESGVLDNKLSKERAKIQVKRRPSTRRARLEAVRKSTIEIGSDSTDNSSSIDEPKPKSGEENIKTNTSIEYIDRTKLDIVKTYSKIDDNLKIEHNIENVKSNNATDYTDSAKTDNIVTDKFDRSLKIERKTDVKSKVVYILNDEDIFSPPIKETKPEKPKQLNIVDDADLFKTNTDKKLEPKPKEVITDTKAKSLFDDSDEELFSNKQKQTNKKVEKVKKSIFDSDSDDDLFFGKKKEIEKKDKVKKEIPKGPLFDDESDDDIFGSKTKKIDKKPQVSKAQSESKSTEPVFEDPLSMLGDGS